MTTRTRATARATPLSRSKAVSTLPRVVKATTARLVSPRSGLGGAPLPEVGTRRLCKKCGQVNLADATDCAGCNSTRLAPPWVLARHEVTKQFDVQITSSSEQFGTPQPRVTLTKWWPGSAGRNPTLHINNPEQWQKIRDAVEKDFGPRLGWTTLAGGSPGLPRAGVSPTQLRNLVKQHPEIASRALAEELGPGLGPISAQAIELVQRISRAQERLESPYVDAYQKLVEELPRHGGAALVELQNLLEGWSLHQVTQVTGEVRRRLQTLGLFQKLMLDDKTYEIRGDRSIHRVLEGAMWIVDERYWLMASNVQLRTLIGRAVAQGHAKTAMIRPDFACAQMPGRGIIVEIKRPSHRLTLADLNQAESYVVLAEDLSQRFDWSGILVGQAMDEEVRKTVKHRKSVTVRTYNELLEDAEHRYREYLRVFQEDAHTLADELAHAASQSKRKTRRP